MAYKNKYDLTDSINADIDARNAEQMANAQSRLTQAEIKMAENRAVSTPRMMELRQEQARNSAMDDVFAAARQRRLDSQRKTALADPGRYAPSVYRDAKEWADKGGLRQHELDMLKQTGENEFRVAEQKRLGMKEQGSDAAGSNAEATKYGWDKQLEMEEKRQSGLTEREKIIGDRTERIAGMEHGTIGPDGKVTPGSRERVATITGQSAVQQQTEANKGLAAQAEINRQKQQEQIAAQIQRSIIAAGGKADAAKIAWHAKIIGEAIRSGSLTGKDPATVMAELAEQYKNDPEMLKSIQGAGGQQQGNVAQKYQDGQIVDVEGGKARYDAKTKKFVMVK